MSGRPAFYLTIACALAACGGSVASLATPCDDAGSAALPQQPDGGSDRQPGDALDGAVDASALQDVVADDALSSDAPQDSPGVDASSEAAADVAAADSGEVDASGDGSLCGGDASVCAGACVDLMTDAFNCGRCGHGCLGTGCNKGLCSPAFIPSAFPSGSFDVDFAIDAQKLYRLYSGSDFPFQDPNNTVTAAPLAGGTTETLATVPVVPSSPPRAIATDGTNVCWLQFFAIYCVPAAGGVARTVLARSTFEIQMFAGPVFGDGLVYVASQTLDPAAPPAGAIHALLPSGGEFATIDIGQLVATQLVVNSTDAYFAANAEIYRVALTGGPSVALVQGQGIIESLALDGTHLYWTDGYHLRSMPLDAQTFPIVLAEGSGLEHVVVDASGVYWDDDTGIQRQPPGGGPTTRVLDAALVPSFSVTGPRLLLDQESVYFSFYQRVAKP